MRLKPLALIAALAAMPVAAEACSCLPYDTVEEKIAAIDYAFVGIAEETLRVWTEYGESDPLGYADYVTRFSVSRGFMGLHGSTIYVTHRKNSAACGMTFEPGKEHFVVLHKSDQGELSTGLCSNATYTNDGKSLLGALRARFPGK